MYKHIISAGTLVFCLAQSCAGRVMAQIHHVLTACYLLLQGPW